MDLKKLKKKLFRRPASVQLLPYRIFGSWCCF